MRNHILLLLAVCFLLCFASPAQAADSTNPVVFGNYFDEFVGYWKEKAKKQNAMVIGVLILGAIGILIIMTSKKGKK